MGMICGSLPLHAMALVTGKRMGEGEVLLSRQHGKYLLSLPMALQSGERDGAEAGRWDAKGCSCSWGESMSLWLISKGALANKDQR